MIAHTIGVAHTMGFADLFVVAQAAPVVLAQAASLGEVLDNLRNVVMGLLAGIATVFLTYAGVLYLTAGGDPGQVERAKAALRNSAIGYGVAVLAPVLLSVIKQIVGA